MLPSDTLKSEAGDETASMRCKIQIPPCGQIVFPIKWLSVPLFSFLINFFQNFCFKIFHLEVLSDTKEGKAPFSNTLGKTVPHLQLGLQTSSVFTFGKGGREECWQASVLAPLPSLLLGGADFVLIVGWVAECRFEEHLPSWPNPLFGSWLLLLLILNCWVYCCPKQMTE